MSIVRPRWSSWSFLLYIGGFTILGASIALLTAFAARAGDAAFAAEALGVFAAAMVVALALRRGDRHPVAAGVSSVIALALWTAFVGALFAWFGWLGGNLLGFDGFGFARVGLVLLVLVAALVELRLFRFPLLVLPIVATVWFLVTDVLSGGGRGSAVVTLIVGVGFFVVGAILDLGEPHPYAFWLHVAAGLAFGGGLLDLLHSGDGEWTVIALVSLAYVGVGARLRRSSWAVLGAFVILASAQHVARGGGFAPIPLGGGVLHVGGSGGAWRVPIVYGITGILLMTLGGLIARAQRSPSAAMHER